MDSKRIDKWDNVKCVLILLVVLGHFAIQFTDDSIVMRIIALFIYSFHMPLFIFMSGLVERRMTVGSRFNWNKAVYYCAVGYVFKIVIFFTKRAFGKHPVFHWISDTGIPWYMFAMAAFYALTYLLRNRDCRLVLGISLFLSCIAGYCDDINSLLNLSRILVFFPFYYLGYLCDPERLLAVSKKGWVKGISAAVLAAGVALFIYLGRTDFGAIKVFTGRNPYSEIHHGNCGFWNRALFYVIAFVLSWAVLNLIPGRHSGLMSRIGSRTLQIYFWHRLALYCIKYTGLMYLIHDHLGAAWGVVFMSIAVLLTVLLSAKPFGIPLQYLRKAVYALCDRLTVTEEKAKT